MRATTELDRLGLDGGGHLIVARALAPLRPGDQVVVAGTHPALRVQLMAWCRTQGHGYTDSDPPVVTKGPAGADKGANYLAIAYSKAGEMASTLKDSGGKTRPSLAGEVGWQGGATSAGKTGLLFAAFSGGKGEQDYQISKAGLAVLGQSL